MPDNVMTSISCGARGVSFQIGICRLAEVDELLVEGPAGNRFDLDFKARVERVDLLREVQVDHLAVIEAETVAERVERDLEAAIEVAAHGRGEIEGEVDAEEGRPERLFRPWVDHALRSQPLDLD